jgi:hypothetical protein
MILEVRNCLPVALFYLEPPFPPSGVKSVSPRHLLLEKVMYLSAAGKKTGVARRTPVGTVRRLVLPAERL